MVAFVENSTQPDLNYVAGITELRPEILSKLVRDGVITGSAPYREARVVGWCDLGEAMRVADQLKAARYRVEGQPIQLGEAMLKYKFSSPSFYRWRDEGWLTVLGQTDTGDTLFNEGDIAFARALADLSGHTAGKRVFPKRKQ